MGQGFVIETINFFNSRKPSFPSPFSRQSQKREYLGCLNALWKTDGIDSVDVNDVVKQHPRSFPRRAEEGQDGGKACLLSVISSNQHRPGTSPKAREEDDA